MKGVKDELGIKRMLKWLLNPQPTELQNQTSLTNEKYFNKIFIVILYIFVNKNYENEANKTKS